ncbi:MAG: hypothetical protein WB780_02615 [Candidatus Acidiferrales bacterium]
MRPKLLDLRVAGPFPIGRVNQAQSNLIAVQAMGIYNERAMRIAAGCLLVAVGTLVLPSLKAQSKTTAQVVKTEPTIKPSAKIRPKIDRRYAIGSGSWSAATISLFNTWSAWDDNPGRHMFVYSPDRRKLIEVIGAEVTLHIDGQRFETGINNLTKHDAELGWAPDSTKFFVNWTETGELGPWHMQVYGIDESGVHELPKVEEPARKDFEHRVRQLPIEPELDSPELRAIWDADEYCEPYHVIGGRWLKGSQEILLSVLIRNTSECKYMSAFAAYRVNANTGEIVQRFTAAEGHRLFGDKYLPLITR